MIQIKNTESLSYKKNAFTTILFDWGGVFTIPRKNTQATKNIEKKYNIQSGELAKVLYENKYWDDALVGRISDTIFWEKTLSQLGINDAKGIVKFKNSLFKGERFRLRSGMINLITQLRQTYTIALLTNADDIFRSILREKFHSEGFFDYVIISSEIGLAKPDTNFFRKSCSIIGTKPTNCIFIDDSQRNIQAAKSIGIYSVLYNNNENLKTKKLIRDLSALGIVLK